MEGGKQSGSSLASDLFGSRDSSTAASSSGIFGSIFPPPPTSNAVGRDRTEKKKNGSGNLAWSAITGVSDKNAVDVEEQSQGTISKDISPYYQEQRVQPFHYSSSIYYGGQDVYFRPQDSQNPGITTDIGEDDSGCASRGNWWQGSLYY